jgi:subtilisin-like proprotein convertase family protein
MKRILTLAAAMVWAGVATAQTQATNFTFSSYIGATVQDNDPGGLALTYDLTGMGGTISNVTVSLDLSGGYNGDLYAYLAGPNGGFSVLLNRTGVGTDAGESTYGYADTGFNVTFSDTGAGGIQYYENASPTIAAGVLQGTWQPEGVTIDPQSPPTAFSLASSGNTPLSSFVGTDPNGTWTLFLTDLAAGNQSVVGPVSVDITTVPEPASPAIAACGGLALLILRQSRQRHP